MKTFWSFTGSSNNAEKIEENHLIRLDYRVPLEHYKDSREDFMKRYGLDHLDYSLDEFISKVEKHSNGKAWITGGSLLHFNICDRYTVAIKKDDPILAWDEESETETEDTLRDRMGEIIAEFCFYKATLLSENGLADLIEIACSNAPCHEYAEELLEKIILADYSNINEFYTPTFLLLVANCLMGEYSFSTMRNYGMAHRLYQRVSDPKSNVMGELVNMAERKMNCCKLLSSSKLNPPTPDLLKKIDEDSTKDDFSGTLLALYYLTSEDYFDQAKYELGMQYLNKAISNNYRPALHLYKYLGDNKYLRKYDKSRAKQFIKQASPRVIGSLLSE